MFQRTGTKIKSQPIATPIPFRVPEPIPMSESQQNALRPWARVTATQSQPSAPSADEKKPELKARCKYNVTQFAKPDFATASTPLGIVTFNDGPYALIINNNNSYVLDFENAVVKEVKGMSSAIKQPALVLPDGRVCCHRNDFQANPAFVFQPQNQKPWQVSRTNVDPQLFSSYRQRTEILDETLGILIKIRNGYENAILFFAINNLTHPFYTWHINGDKRITSIAAMAGRRIAVAYGDGTIQLMQFKQIATGPILELVDDISAKQRKLAYPSNENYTLCCIGEEKNILILAETYCDWKRNLSAWQLDKNGKLTILAHNTCEFDWTPKRDFHDTDCIDLRPMGKDKFIIHATWQAREQFYICDTRLDPVEISDGAKFFDAAFSQGKSVVLNVDGTVSLFTWTRPIETRLQQALRDVDAIASIAAVGGFYNLTNIIADYAEGPVEDEKRNKEVDEILAKIDAAAKVSAGGMFGRTPGAVYMGDFDDDFDDGYDDYSDYEMDSP